MSAEAGSVIRNVRPSIVSRLGAGSSNAAIAILAAGVVARNATARTIAPMTAEDLEAQVGMRDSASPDLMVSFVVMVVGP